MSKIALVNIGMHGHVNPTLGFTEALVRRGHEVLYFADAEFAPQVERTGAKLIPYGSGMGKMAAGFALIKRDSGSIFAQGPTFTERRLDELEATLPNLLKALEEHRPDVIVYSFISLAARLAAQRLKIPAVMFFTTYASNDHFDLIAETFAKSQVESAEQKAAGDLRLKQILAQNDLPPLDLAALNNPIEPTNLVFMPRRFQPEGATFDERYAFIGPCLRSDELTAPCDLVPAGAGPLALVALGTVFNSWPEFYHDCIKAFTGTPWRVVMAVGPHTGLASLGELPPNIVVRPQLPQLALLQQAELFVSHGGMNSTMESFYHGVPMVVIPQMEEQELTAQQVDQLKLGRFLHRSELTAAGLAAAVAEVAASAEIRANVDRLQAEVQGAGGTPRAVAIIEAAAAQSPAVSSEAQVQPKL